MGRPLAIIKTGTTVPDVATRRGDFEQWFAQRTGIAPGELTVVEAFRDAPLPEPSELRGVIVTGSAAMVTAREPWSERTARWLARAADGRTPMLAVCYGHQLLAHGLGGRVGINPSGREIGTVHVELGDAAAEDALFSGLPQSIRVQATHVESVLELPQGAQWLAGNGADPHQAYRIGTRVWAVQFHPEFDADIIRGYILARRDALQADGLDPDALAAEAADSDHGTRILQRFAAQLPRE